MITVKEVQARVAEITDQEGDPERAHGFEDYLWEEVLQAIADGAEDPMDLARAALQTTKLEFPRWCA